MTITFTQAKAIVRAAEESTWTQGTYLIEDEGFEDATHYLVVRGAAEAMGDSPNPNYIIVPGFVPLVDKRTGEIEYVVPHAGGCAAPRHDAAGAWLLSWMRPGIQGST